MPCAASATSPGNPVLEAPFQTADRAAVLTACAFLSPLFGFLLELLLAARFGGGGLVDGYRVASYFIIFAFTFFFTQLLPHTLIPRFAELRQRHGGEAAWRALAAMNWLPGFCALSVLMATPAAGAVLVRWMAPGLDGEAREAALLLARCAAFSLPLLVWCGGVTSALHTHRVFWVAALSPLLMNAAQIACLLGMARRHPLASVAAGMLAGVLVVVALHAWQGGKLAAASGMAWRHWFPWRPRVPRDLLSHSLMPLAAGFGAAQLLTVLLMRELSRMEPGALAIYGYAFKLTALSYLPGAALATVVLPGLADASARGEASAAVFQTGRAMRMAMLISVSTAALLWAAGDLVVGVLFGFTALSGAELARMSVLFSILLAGAPCGVAMSILVKFFASTGRSAAVLAPTAGALAAAAALLPALAGRFGVEGAAATHSIFILLATAGLAAGYLLVSRTPLREAGWGYLLRLAALAAVVSAGVAMARKYGAGWLPGPAGGSEIPLAWSLAVGAVLIVGIACALRIPEMKELLHYARWRLARRLT